MTDYFAFFDFPRRPLIDEALLKERFTRLSRSIHPDKSPEAIERAHDGDQDFRHDFAVAVAGFKILSQPESRIAHLLELEFGSRKCDYSGKELQRERVALIGQTTGPLAAGATKPFRLAFDDLAQEWNQSYPTFVIAQIQFQ